MTEALAASPWLKKLKKLDYYSKVCLWYQLNVFGESHNANVFFCFVACYRPMQTYLSDPSWVEYVRTCFTVL
jgi:hypothetical protein